MLARPPHSFPCRAPARGTTRKPSTSPPCALGFFFGGQEAAGAPDAFKVVLRQEGEAIAAEARREAPGDLARTIEVADTSQGETIAFAVGTPDPAGRAAELGTL